MGISFDGDVISLASCIDACLLGDTSVGAVCIFFSFAGLYHCSRFCQVRSYSEADALSILRIGLAVLQAFDAKVSSCVDAYILSFQ